MKKISILLCAIITPLALGETLTLVDLKKLARNASYKIKTKEIDTEIFKLKSDITKSQLYPKLGLEAEREWIKSSSTNETENLASIYGEVNLFNGFRDKYNIDKGKISLKLSKKELENSIASLGIDIEELFYRYLYAKKKLLIITDEMNRTNSHSKLVRKRYSSSLITESDIIEFQLHKKRTKSLKNLLKLRKEELKTRLKLIIGKDLASELNLKGDIPHLKILSGLEEIINLVRTSPKLVSLRSEKSLLELDSKNANSDWYPKVDLRAEHGKLDEIETGLSSSETSSKIALTVTWELFSGTKTVKNQKLVQHNLVKNGYRQQQIKQEFNVLINSSFRKMKLLENTIEYEEENEKLAEKLYRKTLAEYKKGVKDSSALVDSSQKISESQNRVFELKLDYILAKLNLEKFLGRTLEFAKVH